MMPDQEQLSSERSDLSHHPVALDSSMGSDVVSVAPLEYANTSTTDCRSIVRGVLLAALCLLGGQLLFVVNQLARALDEGGWSWFVGNSEWVFVALPVAPLIVGVIGAAVAIRFKWYGRTLLLVGMALLLVVIIFDCAWSQYQLLQRSSGLIPYRVISIFLAFACQAVFPILLCWMLTRRVVRDLFQS